MDENTYRMMSIFLQVAGVLVLIFGGGKWIGGASQSLKQLSKIQTDFLTTFTAHVKNDTDHFDKINKDLQALSRTTAVIKDRVFRKG